MRWSLLSFTKVWIWRLATVRNISRLCATGFASFMRQLFHPLARSRHSVCPSLAKVEEMLNWVAKEVKALLDMVWRPNDNFVVLGI
jgi:hypothetical protein